YPRKYKPVDSTARVVTKKLPLRVPLVDPQHADHPASVPYNGQPPEQRCGHGQGQLAHRTSCRTVATLRVRVFKITRSPAADAMWLGTSCGSATKTFLILMSGVEPARKFIALR